MTTCGRRWPSATADQVMRWNPRFWHPCGHYAFHSTACTPATPLEVGSGEGSVRYVKFGVLASAAVLDAAQLDLVYATSRDRFAHQRSPLHCVYPAAVNRRPGVDVMHRHARIEDQRYQLSAYTIREMGALRGRSTTDAHVLHGFTAQTVIELSARRCHQSRT